MAGFDDPAFYGDRQAAVYDEHHQQVDPGPAAEVLAGPAGDGRVREVAIGTGRLALPLAVRGITVKGLTPRPVQALASGARCRPSFVLCTVRPEREGRDRLPVTPLPWAFGLAGRWLDTGACGR